MPRSRAAEVARRTAAARVAAGHPASRCRPTLAARRRTWLERGPAARRAVAAERRGSRASSTRRRARCVPLNAAAVRAPDAAGEAIVDGDATAPADGARGIAARRAAPGEPGERPLYDRSASTATRSARELAPRDRDARLADEPPSATEPGAAAGLRRGGRRSARSVGRPRADRRAGGDAAAEALALPIFASDPISSVAYATEAALVVLVGASLTSLHLVLPISVAISALLAIVVALVPPDGPRLRDERRLVRRRARRTSARCRASSPARRCSPTTCSPSRSRSRPGSSRSRPRRRRSAAASRAALARLRRRAHAREPARRARVRLAVRVPDVRLHRRAVRARSPSASQVHGRHAARMRDGAAPACRPAPARSTLFVLLQRVRVRLGRADRRRGDLERRHRLPPPAGEERGRRRSLLLGAIAITLFLGVSWLAVQMHARPSATASVALADRAGDVPGRLRRSASCTTSSR